MYFDRSMLEELEDKALAPYGMRSKNTKGRAYLDNEPEYRTAFQRDRDRILHTTAFRRLEYKTQVFINYEGDYFRTRLTHTLEVAQIGRTLARALGANEDLVETICLAHDLGHSPFGHSGEVALNRLMKDFGGFDHNKQSLRIVTELEQRYPEFPGLNLTWEVREGMVKHESEYDISDARDFDPSLRGNLETQICNVADELAYTTHDLDDGLRSGLIFPQMLEGIALWEILRETFNWRGPNLDDMERHRMIRHLVGLLVTDIIQATDGRLKESKAKSAAGHSKAEAQRHRLQRGHAAPQPGVEGFPLQQSLPPFPGRADAGQGRADHHQPVQRLPRRTCHPARLLTKNCIAIRGLERTICDYIAGMTDRFAVEEHARLFDPSLKP